MNNTQIVNECPNSGTGMNRLYRLKNKNGTCWWTAAPDLESALRFSVQYGHAKKIENIKIIGDQTDFMLQQNGGESLRKQLEEGVIGIGGVRFDPHLEPKHKWRFYNG